MGRKLFLFIVAACLALEVGGGCEKDRPTQSYGDPTAIILISPTEGQTGDVLRFSFDAKNADYIAISFDGGITVDYVPAIELPKTIDRIFDDVGSHEVRNTAYGNGKWSSTEKRLVNIMQRREVSVGSGRTDKDGMLNIRPDNSEDTLAILIVSSKDSLPIEGVIVAALETNDKWHITALDTTGTYAPVVVDQPKDGSPKVTAPTDGIWDFIIGLERLPIIGGHLRVGDDLSDIQIGPGGAQACIRRKSFEDATHFGLAWGAGAKVGFVSVGKLVGQLDKGLYVFAIDLSSEAAREFGLSEVLHAISVRLFPDDCNISYLMRWGNQFRIGDISLPSPIPVIEILGDCPSDQLGSLSVTSIPSGADIRLDGFDCHAATPLTKLGVAQGWYKIELQHQDCSQYFEDVYVATGKSATVHASMRCIGSVRLESDIGMIWCQIEGPTKYVYQGATPHVLEGIQTGDYIITFFDQLAMAPSQRTRSVHIGPDAVTTVSISYGAGCEFGPFKPAGFTQGQYACHEIEVVPCLLFLCEWKVESYLPRGLAFDQGRWVVCGTPEEAGEFWLSLCCKRESGEKQCVKIPMTVDLPPCVPDLTLPRDLILVAGQATNFCWQSACLPDPARMYKVYVNNAFWGEVDDNVRCANLNILTPGSFQVCVELVENEVVSLRECCTVTVETACIQQKLTLQYPAVVKVGQDITICADATCAGPGYDPIRYIFTMNGQPWHDAYQRCCTIVPSAPGKMHFCVELKDEKGNDILKCIEVDVVQDNQAPVPNPGGPYSGTAGGTVSVKGAASDPDGDAITAWEWEFEGQKYLVEEAVLTLPQTAGSYALSLRVKDGRDLWSAIASTTVAVVVANGSIEVTCNNDAGSWSISPGGYSGSGRYTSISDVPPGIYTITWNTVAGYDTPASLNKTLAAGGSVMFNGSYSTTTTPVQVSGHTSMTVTVGQYFNWEWTATGGTPEWGIWFSYSGLPSGVSGDAQGFAEGPCNTIGDFVFNVTGHDAASSANTSTITCTLHVSAPQGQLAVDRDYVDLGGDRTVEEVYVTNSAVIGGPITFNVSASPAGSWLATYPASIGTTNQYVQIKVDRTNMTVGSYTGYLNLTSSGGNVTITVKMAVGGAQCSEVPDLVSPINDQTVSLSDGFDFTWTRVCATSGEYVIYVMTAPNASGDEVFTDWMSPAWTSRPYTGTGLEPYTRYYWFLIMWNVQGTPYTEIQTFYTVP